MSVTKSCRDLNELNPLVKEQAELFLKKCEEQGLKILITETYRSQERQNYLYCQGRTVSEATAKGISSSFAKQYCNPSAKKVTWTLNSNHTSRKAFDICQNIKSDMYNTSVLRKAGQIAKSVGLEWGGDWTSSPDMPHMENQKLNPIPQSAKKQEVKVDEDYIKSINKLHEKGIISDKAAWQNPNLKFINPLLSKIGYSLYKTGDYESSVRAFVENGIITSGDIWLNKTYNENHVSSMIKKLSALF